MESGKTRFQLEMSDYIKIEILGYVKSSFDDVCGMHKHPFWELIYSKEGEGRHLIGEEEIILKKDEICLIPPEIEHDCVNNTSENVKLYIGFSYKYSFSEEALRDRHYILRSAAHIEGIQSQLRELCELFETGDISAEDIEVGKMIAILSQIVRSISAEKVPNQKVQDIRNQNLVEKVKEYLGNNLCRTIKLSELGAMFYLSPHYIGDTFKRITGMSIKQYHDMQRMRYAYELLEDTDLSISEISDRLGFESIHYFSRRFKERYNLPPSQLRKK